MSREQFDRDRLSQLRRTVRRFRGRISHIDLGPADSRAFRSELQAERVSSEQYNDVLRLELRKEDIEHYRMKVRFDYAMKLLAEIRELANEEIPDGKPGVGDILGNVDYGKIDP